MTKDELQKLMIGIAPVMREFTQREIEAATAPLLRRISELESAPYLREGGIWQSGISYGAGAVCSDRGSAWVCRSPTTERPGESKNWRLLVKRGRDGKDADSDRGDT